MAMHNSADIKEICEKIVAYVKNGDPVKDVIEQTPYSETELIYELALAYRPSTLIDTLSIERGPKG